MYLAGAIIGGIGWLCIQIANNSNSESVGLRLFGTLASLIGAGILIANIFLIWS